MIGLALRSLRHRATALWATFVAVALGTALIGSFATLVETATGSVSDADQETLVIMGAVVGGWGAVIVLFSVAGTLGIAVRQREVETGLLRTIGATPGQVRRLVRAEALAVALVAASVGAVIAAVAGPGLLALLRDAGLVAPTVAYDTGWLSPAAAATLVVLASVLAAGVAARRATRGSASVTLRASVAGAARMRWWRVAVGCLLVGQGVAMAVVTVTVTAHEDDPFLEMATSAYGSILVGVGLATLAPALLRWLAPLARPLVGGGPSARLAMLHATRRADLLAGVLAPVIVLTSAAIGTLMLVGIDGRTLDAALADDMGDTITLLNLVVVGMLSLFVAIMIVNAFAAVVSHRRAELRRLWLLGATPSQVQRGVVAEAGVVAAVGVALGAVASLTTAVPFAYARGEGVVPDGQLWMPPVVVAAVALLTLAAGRGAVRSAVRHVTRGGVAA